MSFAFPPIHAFPPFYTRQLHEETWRKQRQLWSDLILSYAAGERLFELDLVSDQTYALPLFFNRDIDRTGKMDHRFLEEIAEGMVQEGRALWLRPKQRLLLCWRRPAEWAQRIHQWVEAQGSVGAIYTVYELLWGDDTAKEDFHGLPESMARLAVVELEKTGRAKLFAQPATSFAESGIKFF